MRVALLFIVLGVNAVAADLVLTGATAYPSPGAEPVHDAVIVIREGRIAEIGPRATTRIPAGAEILNCSGEFITAGFWDSHIHILPPALLHARDSAAAQLSGELDAMLNRWGFTTVFDIASVLDNTLALRSRIESGEVRGPRILTVGEPLWTKVPVYVQDYLTSNHISIPVVTTPSEAAERTRELSRRGVDGIKLFTGSAQAGGQVADMPLAMVRAATEEAHKHHLPVFAHPQNAAGVQVAVDGGVDILAHTVPQMEPWTGDYVAILKRANMALIPTLTLFDSEARKGGLSTPGLDKFVSKMVDELRVFSQAGGEVLFGTDVGYTEHFDTELEYRLMSQAGMNFPQILASLTTNPARRFGYSDRTGRLAAGMEADLVVLDDDPARDVVALSRVRFVIRGGKLLYSAASTVKAGAGGP